MGNRTKTRTSDDMISEIKETIDRFDMDFDDPGTALQDIARILGIDKPLCEEYYDDDDDDDDDDVIDDEDIMCDEDEDSNED